MTDSAVNPFGTGPPAGWPGEEADDAAEPEDEPAPSPDADADGVAEAALDDDAAAGLAAEAADPPDWPPDALDAGPHPAIAKAAAAVVVRVASTDRGRKL